MPTGSYIRTEEDNKKMSKATMGHPVSEETRRKIGKANKISQKGNSNKKGKHLSEESKRKISEAHKGKHYPKISEAKIGKHYPKLSEAQKGRTGEKSNNWQGGISFEPYSVDWTETLKRSIRERDHYTCKICGKEPAVYVHHIDYDKLNCNPENLITLCHSCHSKTNGNREYWTQYFQEIEMPKEEEYKE